MLSIQHIKLRHFLCEVTATENSNWGHPKRLAWRGDLTRWRRKLTIESVIYIRQNTQSWGNARWRGELGTSAHGRGCEMDNRGEREKI